MRLAFDSHPLALNGGLTSLLYTLIMLSSLQCLELHARTNKDDFEKTHRDKILQQTVDFVNLSKIVLESEDFQHHVSKNNLHSFLPQLNCSQIPFQ